MNDASRLTNKIIGELYKNDTLFKLIKYDTPNALERENLTDDEKEEIIKGIENVSNKRIHKTNFNNNLIEDIRSEVRIYKDFMPNNRIKAEVTFIFEILVHRDIWELDNGEERADKILFELRKSLDNKNIDSIGYLQFNHPVKHMFFGKKYNGYILCATTEIEW